MDFKFKVPCDELLDGINLDDRESGSDVTDLVGVYFGGDDGFPQEIWNDGKLYFEFQMGDPVGIWCYTKTKKDAKSMVVYLANLMGERPQDVYHRWIFEV